MKTGWTYTGDVNLSHGGYYFRHTPGDDFAEAVAVEDWESAVGGEYGGVALVQTGTVHLSLRNIREGLKACGMEASDLIGLPRESKACEYAYAACVYNGGDFDEGVYVGIKSRGYRRSSSTADRTSANDHTFRKLVERDYLD